MNFKTISGYRCPDTIVFPGASSTGCGSYIFKSQSSVFHSSWNDEKKVKSSIFRELRAVEHTVVNSKIVLLNGFLIHKIVFVLSLLVNLNYYNKKLKHFPALLKFEY